MDYTQKSNNEVRVFFEIVYDCVMMVLDLRCSFSYSMLFLEDKSLAILRTSNTNSFHKTITNDIRINVSFWTHFERLEIF